ncbi:MAG: amidohydrolase family protein [Acidobacteriota bacterium]|nr:amidohydrolase family protein [Acidobacteriota bacterium]
MRAVVLAFAFLAGPLFSQPVLLLRNVHVVDVAAGKVTRSQAILIRGNRIAEIAPHITAPAGAHTVEGTGEYVIPGLWDMHVHLWYKENQFPLYLAQGITGLRDMGSDLERVQAWRREIAEGRLLGPHIETSGPMMDGVASQDSKLPVLVVRTPADAVAAYSRLEAKRVDFIKIGSRLPRDAYFALLDRARKWRVPVAGHVPDDVTVEEAIVERQASMEHLLGILLACSSEEQKLRAAKPPDMAQILDTFDAAKADRLFVQMARNEAWQCPTLTMWRRVFGWDAEGEAANPLLESVSPAIRKGWKEDPKEIRASASPEAFALHTRQYAALAAIVARMQKNNVPLLAGTDTGDPYTVPGDELHRELELLVRAGLTPAQALRAATLAPAKYFDADEELGHVKAGKRADLVVLEGNPLEDIRNTRKVHAVILGGRYLPKAR